MSLSYCEPILLWFYGKRWRKGRRVKEGRRDKWKERAWEGGKGNRGWGVGGGREGEMGKETSRQLTWEVTEHCMSK